MSLAATPREKDRGTPARWASLAGWMLLVACPPALTAEPVADLPAISIVIDDMGDRQAAGREALALSGALTYAFLPFARHTQALAAMAHAEDKEVMLHLPMAARDGQPLDPGALAPGMNRRQIHDLLQASLSAVPGAAGVNNHMGSLLTGEPEAMNWLMQSLRVSGDLYFIDSRTTEASVAETSALAYGIPASRRDVFLDHEREPEQIRKQFRQLVRLARRQGQAIGIGHPYPETIDILRQELARLPEHGVRLIRASENIKLDRRNIPWQASLSHSPRAAKNSKP